MDSTEIEGRSDPEGRNQNAADLSAQAGGNGKLRLMTIDDLDGRTTAARRALQLAAAIEDDLGGDLTTIQRELAQHAAVLGAVLKDLGARCLKGETIDQATYVTLTTYATLINSQRRVLAAL